MKRKRRSQLAYVFFWMTLFGFALMFCKAAATDYRIIPVFGGLALAALGGLLGTLFASPAWGERIAGTIYVGVIIVMGLLAILGWHF